MTEIIAEYITRIEILSLWGGRNHIVWDLKPDVNILSGVRMDAAPLSFLEASTA